MTVQDFYFSYIGYVKSNSTVSLIVFDCIFNAHALNRHFVFPIHTCCIRRHRLHQREMLTSFVRGDINFGDVAEMHLCVWFGHKVWFIVQLP